MRIASPPPSRVCLLAFVVAILLLVAVLLRTVGLDSVPPGVHYDEIINAELAETALRDGPRIFYDAGGGREGLYHLFLAMSLSLPLPNAWQLRLPSILLGMVAIVFSGLWVSRAFGRLAGLTTLGLMAVAFWTVWIGRVALRATTVTPVAAMAAYLLVRLLERPTPEGRQRTLLSLLCGGAVGLSFYTYRAGSMIFVLFVVFALYLALWHRESAKKLVLPLGVALVVGAPIILLLATQRQLDPRFGQVALPWQAMSRGEFAPVLQGVTANLGMFFLRGDLESHYNLPGRPLFEPLGVLFFIVGVVVALWRWRQPLYAFCLIWLGVGIAPGVFTIPAPSFVHTVSAQGVVFVFPAIAAQEIHRRFWKRGILVGKWGAPALVAILLGVNLAGTVVDYFLRWPMEEEVRAFHQADLALVARDMERLPAAEPVAICSSVLNEDDSFWRSGRQSIRLMIERDAAAVRWYDCGASQLVPDAGMAHLYYPVGAQPAGWLPAPPVDVGQRLILLPGVLRISVDGRQWQERLLQELAAQGEAVGPVQFGNELSFLGYQLSSSEAAAGGEVILLTYWRATAQMPSERSVFVHLLAEDGALAAQGDAFSLLSDTLKVGDLFVQQHRFGIPLDTAAGRYTLSIGVYSRQGDEPPLNIVAGAAGGDARLELTELAVRRP